ncbi:MAG: hypothetical protein HYY06_28680 [Deltaproteobacteria bacterium]|nr:hypothetical protein [Deltaproteobacteria bacterium]
MTARGPRATALVFALVWTAWIAASCKQAPSAPSEVDRIAGGLRAAGRTVGRVAPNGNGGWSVVFDAGEVQWFRARTAEQARMHPIRVLYAYQTKTQPAIGIVELHPTVFLVIMTGERKGDRLELGTARSSPAQVEATIRTALGRRR